MRPLPRPASFQLPSAFDAVVVAASAGGVEALGTLLAGLPPTFPVPLLVVQHVGPHAGRHLREVLQRRTRLQVAWAEEGRRLRPETAYLAPPDRHLEVGPGRVCRLTEAPRVCFVRPAADPLFASAAAAFGPRALGVVLTGMGRDGTAGAQALRAAGGTVLVQAPTGGCFAPSMPASVLAAGACDFVLPLERLAHALVGLAAVPGAAALFGLAAARVARVA